MNLLKTILLALLLGTAAAAAQTNYLYGNVGDYSLNPQPGVQVTLTLLSPNPRTVGNVLVQQDPVATATDTNGSFGFTNVQFGWYGLLVAGQVGTYFTFPVGTNTLGPWPIASLTTNNTAMPPNPATNYITLAQAQALVTQAQGAGADAITNVASANTNTATVAVANNVATITVVGGGGGGGSVFSNGLYTIVVTNVNGTVAVNLDVANFIGQQTVVTNNQLAAGTNASNAYGAAQALSISRSAL